VLPVLSVPGERCGLWLRLLDTSTTDWPGEPGTDNQLSAPQVSVRARISQQHYGRGRLGNFVRGRGGTRRMQVPLTSKLLG